jgi:hypothetical protein
MDQGLVSFLLVLGVGRSFLGPCLCRVGVEHLAPFFPVYTTSYTDAKISFHLAPFDESLIWKILIRNPLAWNEMRFLFQVVPLRATV